MRTLGLLLRRNSRKRLTPDLLDRQLQRIVQDLKRSRDVDVQGPPHLQQPEPLAPEAGGYRYAARLVVTARENLLVWAHDTVLNPEAIDHADEARTGRTIHSRRRLTPSAYSPCPACSTRYSVHWCRKDQVEQESPRCPGWTA